MWTSPFGPFWRIPVQMRIKSQAAKRLLPRYGDHDKPETDERLRIIHAQVADACDKNGWCYVYDYCQGHYHYVQWIDAVDLLRQHRVSLAERA